jgi:hypothetical protein
MPNETQEEIPDGIYHHCGCTLRVKGSGLLSVGCEDQDEFAIVPAASIQLSEQPRGEKFSLVDVTAERASFKIEINEAVGWLLVTGFVHWYKFLYTERPQ